MPGRVTNPDRTGAVVTAGMLLLALLGVATVFHRPIAAVLLPGAAGEPGAADEAPAR